MISRVLLKFHVVIQFEAAKIIGKNQIIQMDIGQAREDTYFINIAAAGSFTELTYSVPSQLKDNVWLFGLFGKRC